MPNVLILFPDKNIVSETFIKAHVDLIKGNIITLHGGLKPMITSEDINILNEKANQETSTLKEGIRKLLRFSPAFLYDRIYFKKVKTYEEALNIFLKENNINVVLAEYGLVGAEVAAICYQANVPLIVHFHGYDASMKSVLEEYKDKYRQMFEKADAIIGVSKVMINKLIELGAVKEKLHYNPYGPNLSFSSVNPDYDSTTFVSIGRFVDKKAPYLTLLAFKKLKQFFPKAKLVMAGDGYLLETCKNLAETLEIDVIFEGAISHAKVVSLFESSFCFIQHSIIAISGDSEGTPVAILEAQAAGLPVISTYHAGIQDIVVHKQTGFLVEEKDVEQMYLYMKQLYEDRNLVREFGKEARKRIATHFTINKHISKINSIIEEVL